MEKVACGAFSDVRFVDWKKRPAALFRMCPLFPPAKDVTFAGCVHGDRFGGAFADLRFASAPAKGATFAFAPCICRFAGRMMTLLVIMSDLTYAARAIHANRRTARQVIETCQRRLVRYDTAVCEP